MLLTECDVVVVSLLIEKNIGSTWYKICIDYIFLSSDLKLKIKGVIMALVGSDVFSETGSSEQAERV